MARYTRRAQVLLMEAQYRRLQTLAEAEEKPLGALLREAAEVLCFREQRRSQKARAARQLLALPGTDMPGDYQEWERRYLDQRGSRLMAEGHGGKPLFQDANILMYAVGKDHPHREACREVLRRIEADDLTVLTSVEVLQELLHRYRALGRPDLATTIYRAAKDL